MKFYECKKCGNVMTLLEDSGVIPVCCGDIMDELIPLSEDSGLEKHVPVIETDNNIVTVKVGEIAHPMLDSHYIKWIILQTDKGIYLRNLKPDDEPIAKFVLSEEEHLISAYEFCNIHSLWKKDLDDEQKE